LRRYSTESNAAKYTFFALFVNQAVLPIVLYSLVTALHWFPVLFQGSYTDFDMGWYNKVRSWVIMYTSLATSSSCVSNTCFLRSMGSYDADEDNFLFRLALRLGDGGDDGHRSDQLGGVLPHAHRGHGLTLIHFSAQRKCFVWDRGLF
jgi:hypothetical protein